MTNIDDEISSKARKLVQEFAIDNPVDFAGTKSLVPGSMILLIEAFAVNANMFALEVDTPIDEGIEYSMASIRDIGHAIAREAHEVLESHRANSQATRTTAEIIAGLMKR